MYFHNILLTRHILTNDLTNTTYELMYEEHIPFFIKIPLHLN
jgi:hypothetical protein